MEVSAVPVDIDREVWEMGKRQSEIVVRLDALDRTLKRSHERIDDVREILTAMNDRDDLQDKRVAEIQSALAEFQTTVRDVQKTLNILKKMLSGAAVLVGMFGALVGVLGAEVFPLILKHAMAVIGF